MIGYLGSLQKRAEADYETQIFRARAQQEAKQRREEEEKFAKEQKMQESIRKHRYETVRSSAFGQIDSSTLPFRSSVVKSNVKLKNEMIW